MPAPVLGACAGWTAAAIAPAAQGDAGVTSSRRATGRWSERVASWVMKETPTTSCQGEGLSGQGDGGAWAPPALLLWHSPSAAAGSRGAGGRGCNPRAGPARGRGLLGQVARWRGSGPPGTAAAPPAARGSCGAGTRWHRDVVARGCGGTGTWWHWDMVEWGHGGARTWWHGNRVEWWHRDAVARGHGGTRSWWHGDAAARGGGGTGMVWWREATVTQGHGGTGM